MWFFSWYHALLHRHWWVFSAVSIFKLYTSLKLKYEDGLSFPGLWTVQGTTILILAYLLFLFIPGGENRHFYHSLGWTRFSLGNQKEASPLVRHFLFQQLPTVSPFPSKSLNNIWACSKGVTETGRAVLYFPGKHLRMHLRLPSPSQKIRLIFLLKETGYMVKIQRFPLCSLQEGSISHKMLFKLFESQSFFILMHTVNKNTDIW